MDLIIAEELLKRKFDQQALRNASGKSYYDSYCQLKQQNEHVSTIILNRIRKWLGLRGLIPQTLVSQSKKRLCEGDIACVFQAINRIPKYFLPHFRNAVTFCKEKIPRDRAPLPTAFSHGIALTIHSFVHPEIRPIISRLVYNEGNADQTHAWKRVMDETNRLSSQFKNSFSLEYPELWGIDPSKGLFTDVVTMHESYFSLKFQVKDAVKSHRLELFSHPNFDPNVRPPLPTDQWMKSWLGGQSHQRVHWELTFYAWLVWKEFFTDENFHWLIDYTYYQVLPPACIPSFINPQIAIGDRNENSSRVGDGIMGDGAGTEQEQATPESFTIMTMTEPTALLQSFSELNTMFSCSSFSTSSSRLHHVDPPLGSISDLCSIDPPHHSPLPSSPTSLLPPHHDSLQNSPLRSLANETEAEIHSLLAPLPPTYSPLPSVLPLLLSPSLSPPPSVPTTPSLLQDSPLISPPTSLLPPHHDSVQDPPLDSSRSLANENEAEIHSLLPPLPPAPSPLTLAVPTSPSPPPHTPSPLSPAPSPSTALSLLLSPSPNQSAAELELFQTKAQYYKLKNARKLLRDLKKGRLDESLFSADELRDLRKRCYQAMVDG